MPLEGVEKDSAPGPELIGRTTELTRLADIAELTAETGARLALVSGEAGIGKSTLVTEFLAQLADAGWGKHVGHCIEYADRSIPFGPVVNILRSVLLDNLEEVDALVGNRRADLSGLLPELGEGGASLVGDVDRLFDAISSTLVEASSRRPLAVLVEDIHWADSATRDLLASLVHSLGSARILVIVTERTGALDRAHPLQTWLAELRRFPSVSTLELAGLSRDELETQAVTILGESPDRRVVEDLVERTGGNPYFSHEILMARREGLGELPTSLVEFLTSRLRRLDQDERDVLRAVAVAGGTVSHRLLAAMLPDLAIGGIVRSLFNASILEVDGSDYAFGHALMREAILSDVLPFEEEELHRLAAEALLAEPRPITSLAESVSLAVHWSKANDPECSLAAAVEAAGAAAEVAAYETAAEMALQGLQEWPLANDPEQRTGLERDQLLLQAAEWLGSCFRGVEAVAIITDALEGWGHDLPAGRRALLLVRMVPIEYNLGNPGAAARHLAEAQALVGDEVSPEAAQVHHRVSKQAVADGQIRPALEAAERAIDIATTEGPRVVLIEALTTRALAVGVADDLETGVALAREARRLAKAEGFVSQVANTYRTEMLIIVFREGRTDACLDASAEGLAFAEEHCGPRWRADFRLDLCLGYVEAGRLNDAEPLFAELLSSTVDDLRRLTVLQTAGLHALAVGSLDLAGVFLADATEIADRYGSAQETGFQFRLLAELARRQGRLDEAIVLIDQALELQLVSDNVTYTRESIVEKVRIVRAFVDLGREEAVEQFGAATALVEEFDGAGPANQAIGSLMELELAGINDTTNPEITDETVRLLESAGFRYEAAQVRLLAIDQLVAARSTDRVRLEREITEVVGIAAEHGMSWIADRAAAVAKAKRITVASVLAPPTASPAESSASYPHDLTPREIEVMSLLAEGLTNKAVGEQLFVSPRTVGTHVSNLLAKLQLTNRGEAAAAYHRLGLQELIDLRDPRPATDESLPRP